MASFLYDLTLTNINRLSKLFYCQNQEKICNNTITKESQCVYLQQMVYQRRQFTTINQLKQAIVTEWGKLSQRFIDHAIGQWCRRLACVVQ